ncbi:TRAP transporter substrate-binding protein [Sporosarcina thermotolerans]|uniref:TRAP transporter substrate-binding protein n=1 Tax=Sporosarcina thermotolerans TaxID=633404 RepID=A0AAW9AAQ2_9BACL|nr:TRAP transporter substrate-binding protein [Sporosarcina thermotolerans]MDW0116208.1 TRAP transporter substrate-binding protein [Sporosarcina thermotolerans]WHT48184.1 TRAP transporter substrate-binding protein [Sporosarcina thermotolerans]
MLNKKILFLLISILTLGVILAGCGDTKASKSSDGDKVIEFNAGHTLSPGSARDEILHKFKEALEEKSDGKMTINIFPQSQLGGEVQMQEAAQSGNQDIVFTSSSTLANLAPEFGIIDLPFLFDSLDEANQVLRSDAGTQLLELLPEKGLIGLGYSETVDRNVFANKPIHTAKDLAGLKIRIIEAPGYVETYKAVKAQPTPMAYSELYTSLQQGVIDGGDTSADQFVMDKFMEVSDYFSLTQMNYIAIVAIMSKDVWDGLTPEQQTIVQEAFNEASDFAPEEFKRQRAQYLEEMKAKGIEVVEPDLDSLKEATKGVQSKIIGSIPNGQKLFDTFQKEKENLK